MTLTYAEVGATRSGPLPPGYRHLRHRRRIGAGDGVYRAAGRAVLEWRMHDAIGVRVAASAPVAAPGVTVRTGLGVGPLRLTMPCEVVWSEDGPDRAGFGYGTLAGHPASGEESFVVSRDAAGTVWFEVTAFSRPVRWWWRLGGPVVPLLQRAYAVRCARAVARLATRGQ